MARRLYFADRPLCGEIAVPGDKSVSHRAALLALLADGPCTARGWLDCADTRSSLAAVRALGAVAERVGDVLTVQPPAAAARADFAVPGERIIDCGNSGTTCRLLCGLLAGWLPVGGTAVVLTGDASLSSRPMGRVVEPLRALGADIEALGEPGRLPLRVRGAVLRGGDIRLAVPSAQVKSALLLAALGATGPVTVRGAGGSRDHSERLLALMGRPVSGEAGGDALTLSPGAGCGRFDLQVPGDPSTAAFLLTAALLVPGSRLAVRRHSLNPGRIGALAVLRRAGAALTIEPDAGPATEPTGTVTAAHSVLRGFSVGADEVPALVDELPVLAVAAALAAGRSVVSGAAELKVKESDRITATGEFLRALGAAVDDRPDGWIIDGPAALCGGGPDRPLRLASRGDHRIAMAAAVAGLAAAGHSELDDPECTEVSFPEFFPLLDRLTARD